MSLKLSSIKFKIGFVVAILAAVSLVIGAIAITRLSDMNNRINRIVDVSAQRVLLAAQIKGDLAEIHRNEKNLVLAESEERMDEHIDRSEGREEEMLDRLSELEQIATDEGLAEIESFRDSYQRFDDVSSDVAENTRRNTNNKAYALSSGAGRSKYEAAESRLRDLAESNQKAVDKITARLKDGADEATTRLVNRLADSADRALLSSAMLNDLTAIHRAEKNLILARTDEQMNEYIQSIESLDKKLRNRANELERLASDDNADNIAEFRELYQEWLGIDQRVRDLSREASNRKARMLSSGKGKAAYDEAAGSVESIVKSNNASMDKDIEASDRSYAAASMLVVASSAIGIIAGVAVAWLVVRKILAVLSRIIKRVSQIASGDLSGEALRVEGRDELAELTGSVNTMFDNLKDMIARIKSTSHEVAGAATEVSGTSEELSSNVDGQKGQIQQVSAATEELSRSISDVASNCNQASNTAGSARESAENGGGVVTNTVEQMNGISQTVSSTTESVQSLGTQAESIGKVIQVINDIADQTNLLALNAAIEAARAGEQGRGFAVVADEVRGLAERTTEATSEVTESIQSMQAETRTVVDQIGSTSERVQQGVALATEAGDALSTIVNGSGEVDNAVSSIAATAEQQAAASNQIAENVQSISSSGEQVVLAAQQSASAATELSRNAEELNEIISRFSV